MHKELLVSIFLGVFIGLLIALGIWRFNRFISEKKQTPEISLNQEKNNDLNNEAEKIPEQTKIALSEPEENDILVNQPYKFLGVTQANSLIVISSENKDYIIQSDAQGGFSQDVELVGGVNQIVISSFDQNSNKTEIKRTVVYSTEFLNDSGVDNQQEVKHATDSQKTIEEKVKQKIEFAKKNPKAFIGVVTDKGQDFLQLKNTQGEIKLASIPPDASFVKIAKTTTNISFNDIAIGDFVVAMGFLSTSKEKVDNKGLLEVRRILVTQALQPTTRTILLGEIVSKENRKITLKENEKNWIINFPKRWEGPEIKELSIGDKIIVVGEADAENINLRTIKIVSKS